MKIFGGESILIISIVVLICALFLIPEPELHWDWNSIDISPTLTSYFPKDFKWGVATSAHQVEGNCTNNQWYKFEQQPNRIKNGDVSGRACDHWNKYKEDIQLMKKLGVNSYRFSVEWSKIQPKPNEYSEEVLNHYEDVINECINNGITPMITLLHFTHPIWFDDLGAFEKEENIKYFVEFSKKVFNKFSDKVKWWCTINEPEIMHLASYIVGNFPPGKQDPKLAAKVLKHLMMAHVAVYRALKSLPNGVNSQIGLVKNIMQFDPYHWWNPIDWLLSITINRAFNEAVLRFIEDGFFQYKLPFLANEYYEDKNAIGATDFIGLNYYSHFHVKLSFTDLRSLATVREDEVPLMTDMMYPIYPEGFYRALKRVAQLGKPIIVTENGIADSKDEWKRDLFIKRYLYALSKAIQEGLPIKGYYYWSLYDNFEWAEGYEMRFGLYEIDFKDPSLPRKLRKGASFFVKAIENYFKTH